MSFVSVRDQTKSNQSPHTKLPAAVSTVSHGLGQVGLGALDDADLVGDLQCVEVLGETHVRLLLAVRPATHQDKTICGVVTRDRIFPKESRQSTVHANNKGYERDMVTRSPRTTPRTCAPGSVAGAATGAILR